MWLVRPIFIHSTTYNCIKMVTKIEKFKYSMDHWILGKNEQPFESNQHIKLHFSQPQIECKRKRRRKPNKITIFCELNRHRKREKKWRNYSNNIAKWKSQEKRRKNKIKFVCIFSILLVFKCCWTIKSVNFTHTTRPQSHLKKSNHQVRMKTSIQFLDALNICFIWIFDQTNAWMAFDDVNPKLRIISSKHWSKT